MEVVMQKKEALCDLQNIHFFKNVDAKTQKKIEEKTTLKKYKKNSFIYFPDDTSNQVFFVKKGRVKIGAYSDNGREVIKRIHENGEMFGVQFFLGKACMENYAQAMEATSLFIIEHVEFQRLMEQNNFLAMQMAKFFENRLQKMEKKLESLIFKDARSRIIDFLKDMAGKTGKPIGYETLIIHSLTHLDIAQITATSRQTVTTVLNNLRGNNLIYFDRKRILIRDLAKLQ